MLLGIDTSEREHHQIVTLHGFYPQDRNTGELKATRSHASLDRASKADRRGDGMQDQEPLPSCVIDKVPYLT